MKPSLITMSLLLAGAIGLTNCTKRNTTASDTTVVTWDNSLVLPPADGTTPNIGLAGTYAGIVDGHLLVTGGANFPDGYPWTGAKKVWHTDLYCLDMSTGEWSVTNNFLPEPLAYGYSVQLPDGVLMIGGYNSEHTSPKVNLLTQIDGEWAIDSVSFPDLPHPLSNSAGAMVDNKVFLAGGILDINDDRSSRTFLMLDLSNPHQGWQQLEPWPGSPLGYSVGAEANGKFYLFSGRDFSPEQPLVMHTEGYCYDPVTGQWSIIDNEFPFMAGTAVTHDNQILFIGGVEEQLPTTPDHPGFSKALRRYNPITNVLDTLSVSPYPLAVTTTSFMQEDTLIIASGEERPGIRTPLILRATIPTH